MVPGLREKERLRSRRDGEKSLPLGIRQENHLTEFSKKRKGSNPKRSLCLKPLLYIGKQRHRETKHPAQRPWGLSPTLSLLWAWKGALSVMTGPPVEGCQILQVPTKHNEQRNPLPLS